MRRKSAGDIRREVWLAESIKRSPIYRLLPNTGRAAFDLRREYFRSDEVYVQRLKWAIVGLFASLLSYAAGSLRPDLSSLLHAVAWSLGLISVVVAVRALWAAWHPPKREAHGTFFLRAEKLRDLNIEGELTPFHDVVPEQSDTLVDVKISFCPLSGESFERSTTFDDALVAAAALPFHLREDRSGTFYLPPGAARDRQLDFLRCRIQEKRQTTNDRKFGLAFHLEVPICPFDLYPIGYYDSLLTNEAFRGRIARYDKGDPYAKSEPVHVERLDENFPVEDGRLMPLTVAPTANHVGITTLAITADGYPVVFRQIDRAAIGAGCAVLAGSGSVDWDDIAAATDSSDLKAILAQSMARELQEETLLAGDGAELVETEVQRVRRLRKYRDRTMVTGFFRWVNRCGKPEFVGLTVLPQLRRELLPNPAEVAAITNGERPFLNLPRLNELRDLANIEIAIENWRKGNPAKRNMSLSSAMTLRRAAEIACSDPASSSYIHADRLLSSTISEWQYTARR